MSNHRRRSNPWVNFFITALVLALLTTILLLPEQVIRQTAEVEREQMILWTGKSASEWVGIHSKEFIEDLPDKASEITSLDINQTFKDWMVDRIYVSLIWYDVFVYRMFSAVVWFLVIFPLFMAASIDGYYLREIRKSMFTSQSPLKLRIGSLFSVLSMAGIIVWLLIPIPIPVITAPMLIIVLVFSCWIWTANLQKRI